MITRLSLLLLLLLVATGLAQETATFQADQVTFDYPASMQLEVDESDPTFTFYTVDGDEVTLMLSHHQQGPGLEETVQTISEDLAGQAEGEVDKQDITLELGGQTLPGKRISYTLMGLQLSQEIVAFSSGGSVWVLVLQDFLDDQGQNTAERAAVLELLSRTLKY